MRATKAVRTWLPTTLALAVLAAPVWAEGDVGHDGQKPGAKGAAAAAKDAKSDLLPGEDPREESLPSALPKGPPDDDQVPAEGGDEPGVTEPEPVNKQELSAETEVQKGVAPLGYVGPYRKLRPDLSEDYVPIKNRWLMPFPKWERHSEFRNDEDGTGWTFEYPYTRGGILDPYQQNILKGDYPIIGDDIFFVLTLISDSTFEARAAPTPRGIQGREQFGLDFFGNARQEFINQSFVGTVELFRGATAFRPRDWELRFTGVYNINFTHLQEFNNLNIDNRRERDRTDEHFGIQEAFAEYHIQDISPNYDFYTVRVGIQGFVSDFRGFLFSENQPGVRFSGTYFSNRLQWNLAGFAFLEKDTNSGLNELKDRNQEVFIANLIWQDALKEFLPEDYGESFALLLSYHYNRDHGAQQFDENGFNVRPGRFGRGTNGGAGPADEHTVRVHYLGLAGEGHIGRLNLTFEYFFAFGEDNNNPIADKKVNIRSHFIMAEPSVDFDWLRVKLNFLYAQGDADPESSTATGFDTIVDNPNFAGSEDSFYQRQGIVLPQTTVLLKNRFSFFNSLRTGKNEGQANFVNPGLILMGAGLDARVTPKLRAEFNVNYLMFDRPETMELLVFQREIDRKLGIDYNLGFRYRPLLTDNIIVNVGLAVLQPLEGFSDLYEDKGILYSTFLELVLVY